MSNRMRSDFLIIGSGIAGLRAAIELSSQGKQVILISKTDLEECNTYYAQGGSAAVDPSRIANGEDSYMDHENDTLKAGAGLSNPKVVRQFVRKAYSTIDFLIKQGVKFSLEQYKHEEYPYILHQEGGHSHPRIYCVADYTGRAIEEQLCQNVRQDSNILILEHHTAINLIMHNQFFEPRLPHDRCLGAYLLNNGSGEVIAVEATHTFLATGGAGRAFQFTSNPDVATGDGVAMAFRSGARIANMEFFQFHPTVLFEPNPKDPRERRFLLTEALRGKSMGALLTIDKDSKKDLALKYTDEGSHGTRDIVARAIDTEMKNNGLQHVYLNITPSITGKSPDFIKEHFPKIYEHCLTKGIDITKEAVPVVPAAHYTCGGVMVDEQGRTDIVGLYAIGEVSYTGLMGANRLASNSLPEAALYGQLAVDHALSSPLSWEEHFDIPLWSTGSIKESPDPATVHQFWNVTRSTMMSLCGIARSGERLQAAIGILEGLESSTDKLYRNYFPTKDLVELRNLVLVCLLIARAALQRNESRGGHFRIDFPKTSSEFEKPSIQRRI